MNNIKNSLNPRELDVLNVLYKSGKPMMAADIVNSMPGLTQSTVTAVLWKMLNAGLVEVAGVTHSGKVLSRAYIPTELSKEAIFEHFVESYKLFSNVVSPEDLYEAIKAD